MEEARSSLLMTAMHCFMVLRAAMLVPPGRCRRLVLVGVPSRHVPSRAALPIFEMKREKGRDARRSVQECCSHSSRLSKPRVAIKTQASDGLLDHPSTRPTPPFLVIFMVSHSPTSTFIGVDVKKTATWSLPQHRLGKECLNPAIHRWRVAQDGTGRDGDED